jgi:hypothetical protein
LVGRNEIVQEDLPPMVGMFKLGKNSIVNQFFINTRLRSTESLVTKFEVKDLIRALKDKKLVWYASDQSFTGKNAILVNFFNHPAMTNPSIIRIAKITGSPVLPYFPSQTQSGCVPGPVGSASCKSLWVNVTDGAQGPGTHPHSQLYKGTGGLHICSHSSRGIPVRSATHSL